MEDSITIVSKRSNFLQAPRIGNFHSAFFHGVAHRNGEWSPFESRVVDAACKHIEPLTVWCNRFTIPHYCYPGTWPVVSQEVHDRLQYVDGIRFVPILLGRVVNYPWSVEKPLYFKPGDQGKVKLFKSLPEVGSGDLKARYEMLTYEHPSIIDGFTNLKTISLDIGTVPMSEKCDYQYCEELFAAHPIHWFSGSIIFRGVEWDKIEDLVDAEFLSIRKLNINF